MDYTGQIDFTLVSRLWRDHRELFKEVPFKDGKHMLLDVSLAERREPDEKGNTHYLKARCKKSEERQGLNYYIGSHFKPYQQAQQAQNVQPATPMPESNDELPF